MTDKDKVKIRNTGETVKRSDFVNPTHFDKYVENLKKTHKGVDDFFKNKHDK